MPKKKKSFIDKHQSTTFAVVHRARRDPLSLDDSASPHVLQPTFTGNQRKKADRERHSAATAPADLGDFDQSGRDAKGRLIGRFGGSEMGPGARAASELYDRREWELSSYKLPADGYDYTQHMTDIGTSGGHYIGVDPDRIAKREAELKEAARRKADGAVQLREAVLPEESLASEVYLSNGYEALEHELDPEVLQAMEDAENDAHQEVEWEGGVGWEPLEDDFARIAEQPLPTMGTHLSYAMEQYEQKAALAEPGPEPEPEPEPELNQDEVWEEEEEEPATEEEMIEQIFTWADEDGNGLINLAEFIDLQEACGNDTPNEAQWALMLGALKCDPDPESGGLTPEALTVLYRDEGPYDDFEALGLGPSSADDGPMPEELAELLASLPPEEAAALPPGWWKHMAPCGGAGAAAEDRGEQRLLDEQFDAMASEWDDDDDIGDLARDPRARGGAEIAQFDDVMDQFIAEQQEENDVSLMLLDNKEQSAAMKGHVIARAEAQAAREEERAEAGQADDHRKESVPEYRTTKKKEEWDAETILSTYSNTENHPGQIKTGRRVSKKAQAKAKAAEATERMAAAQAEDPLRPMSGDILLTKKGLPMLPEQAEEELAAAREAEQPKQEQQEQEDEDDEWYDEDEEEEEVIDTGIGRGGKKGKGRKETPEEKRERKKAMKQQRAAARQRKKSLKTAYRKEEAVQGKRQTSAAGAMRGRTVVTL